MRIGFFLDCLIDGYQSQLLLGIHNECVRQGVDLYCLVGGIIDPSHAASFYDLAGKQDFDGLIVSGSTMFGSHGTTALPTFMARFPDIPKVCVGATAEDIPGILVDHASGVREMVGHLVQVHHRKRIAFLRVRHPDGEERYQGYLAGLADAGLVPDKNLIIDSQFVIASGREASERLRRESFDAVVASNDWQAIGLIAALQLRGVRVPDDVAVTGFDDIVEANFMIPSLSTVRQPIRHLGAMAVADLLARLRGKPGIAAENVPTKSCFRASCGCRSVLVPTLPPPAQAGLGGIRHLIQQDQALMAILARHGGELGLLEYPHATQGLVESLLTDLQDCSHGKFISALGLQLDRASGREGLTHWHVPLMELRAACMPYLIANPAEALHAMDLFEKAHVLVSTNAECAQGHQRLAKHRLFQELHGLGRHWRESLALGHPTKSLMQQLDLVGIPSVYLVRRAEGTPPTGDAQLSFSYLNSRTSQVCQPRVFRAGEIVPRTEAPFRRHTMVIYPLEQGDGYCAVEMGPEEPQVYNATHEHITVARYRLGATRTKA